MPNNKTLVALSAVFVFLLFFLPAVDSDLGWHLRYGEYFIQTGHFLKNNILTYYLPGYFWQNSYSVYQIITFLTHQYLSFSGLSLLNALLFGWAFYLYNRINPRQPKINLLLFLLTIVFAWSVLKLGWRAQELSFLGLILLFYLLTFLKDELKIKNLLRLISAIFLLFIVWTNLHGGYILGLIVLFFYLLQSFLNRQWLKLKQVGVLLAAGTLGTLINPYFAGIYNETFKHAFYPLPTLIAEWVAPPVVFQILIGGFALVLIFLCLNSKNPNRFFWLLTSLFFAYLAIKSRRNLPQFAITASLAVTDLLREKIYHLEIQPLISKLYGLIIILGFSYLLFINVPRVLSFNSNWQNYCTQGMLPYPCRAVEFIRQNQIQGKNVYSSYEWGGFLEWQLPQYLFFVDGRTPAWITAEGKSPYTVYLEIIQAQPEYQQRLEKYNTDWLLIGAGTFLDIELQSKNAVWKEIFRDNISVIYIPR